MALQECNWWHLRQPQTPTESSALANAMGRNRAMGSPSRVAQARPRKPPSGKANPADSVLAPPPSRLGIHPWPWYAQSMVGEKKRRWVILGCLLLLVVVIVRVEHRIEAGRAIQVLAPPALAGAVITAYGDDGGRLMTGLLWDRTGQVNSPIWLPTDSISRLVISWDGGRTCFLAWPGKTDEVYISLNENGRDAYGPGEKYRATECE